MATEPTDIKRDDNEDDDGNIDATNEVAEDVTSFADKADILLIDGWYRSVEASDHAPTDEPDEREKRIRAWLRRRIDGVE